MMRITILLLFCMSLSVYAQKTWTAGLSGHSKLSGDPDSVVVSVPSRFSGTLNVGGALAIAKGTEGAPGIHFVGDTDTGIWWGGSAGRWYVTIGGATQYSVIANAWQLQSALVLRWNSSGLGGWNDVGLSRVSAGVLGIGGASGADVAQGETDGTILVGEIGLGTSTFDASADQVLAVGNGTAPAAGTANQSYLYAKDVTASSEMHVMDEAGNETVISPHDPKTGKWIFYSKNVETGRVLRIEMEDLIFDLAKEMQEKTGKKYVYESKPLEKSNE